MPRDSNGTMSLVSGNPVVPGTTITDSWANNTLNDIKAEITDSLSRSGKGGMLVPFENLDGNEANPGITFEDETTSGLYRAGSGDVRMSLLGDDITQFSTSLIKFISHVTDGASAVGLAIDTVNALSTSGAKLLRIMTNAVEKFVIDKDGYVYSDLYRVLSAVPAALKGNQADGASAVGVILDCLTALSTSGAKVLSVRNNGVEKAYLDKDGRFVSNGLDFIGAALQSIIKGGTGGLDIGTSIVSDLRVVLNSVAQWTFRSSDGALVSNGKQITGLPAPVVSSDGANKEYVDKIAQISSSSGSFSLTSASGLLDVTNLSVTITTRGRPVLLALISGEPDVTPSFIGMDPSASVSAGSLWLFLLRGTTEIMRTYGVTRNGTASDFGMLLHGGIMHIDTPTEGTYTYKVQAQQEGSNITGYVKAMKLVAVEL